jgi:hypothetical protein
MEDLLEDLWRIYGVFMEDLCKIYRGFMEDLWGIYGGFMTDLWRIYGQVFRILIFEFRMTPKTTENQ